MKLSRSWDICVFTKLLLSEGSLVKGGYWGVTLEIEEGVEWFQFLFGSVERLKGRLGNCRWAGFGVVNFVGVFKIGIIKLGNSIIYSGG